MDLGMSVFCMSVSAVICLFAPAALAIVMIKRSKASWKAFLLGAAVFAASQLLIRIPLINLLQDTVWFALFTQTNTLLYILLLAFSAGVFEEGGRFLGMKFFLKKDLLTWENGIVFGLGHGGIEAFWLVGIKYVSLLINTAGGQNTAAVLNTPSAYYLLGGLERILAVTLQIGLSLLVLYAVKYRKIRYLLLALFVHTVVDGLLPVFGLFGFSPGVWGSEGFIAVFAALAVLIIVKFKARLNQQVTS